MTSISKSLLFISGVSTLALSFFWIGRITGTDEAIISEYQSPNSHVTKVSKVRSIEQRCINAPSNDALIAEIRAVVRTELASASFKNKDYLIAETDEAVDPVALEQSNVILNTILDKGSLNVDDQSELYAELDKIGNLQLADEILSRLHIAINAQQIDIETW